MMNRPVSAFSALKHSILYDSEQFCDCFDGNFASLALNSSPQFVKGLCFPSAIVRILFEGSPVVFDGAKGGHCAQILLLWNESDAIVLLHL